MQQCLLAAALSPGEHIGITARQQAIGHQIVEHIAQVQLALRHLSGWYHNIYPIYPIYPIHRSEYDG